MGTEGHTESIRDRINAFNLAGRSEHLTRAPITANLAANKTGQRPELDQRSQSTSEASPSQCATRNGVGNEPNIARRDGVLPPPSNIVRTGQNVNQAIAKKSPVPPPQLPHRNPSTPALPPRRPCDDLHRKTSNESLSSNISSASVLSNGTHRSSNSRTPSIDAARVRAPAFDAASLPPLPPKQTKDQLDSRSKPRNVGRAPQRVSTETRKPSLRDSPRTLAPPTNGNLEEPPTLPTLPPRRPSKPDQPTLPSRRLPPPSEQAPPQPARPVKDTTAQASQPAKPQPSESLPPAKPPRPLTRSPEPTAAKESTASTEPHRANGVPPPVPTGTRPDLAKIQASKPKPTQTPTASSCLVCRDFTQVDTHAAKFPRSQVPSLDWLATQLTSPFPSLTDKARVIFTWMHHNISYDVDSFFAGNVQPSTPASTLQSGLAVCEGYSALFSALAVKTGMESLVVGGHGKGFGFAQLAPGSSLPPEDPSGHAWNAVRIDNGVWKLIDCCWGAGHISGPGQPYTAHFSPRMFTMSNAEFGLRHFPRDRRQFFLESENPPTWASYILGPIPDGQQALQIYSGVAESEGISETSFTPPQLHIPITSGSTRFSFSRVCEHWSPTRNGQGKDFVFILAIHGLDGREDDFVPFETNGLVWWCDVDTRKLGAPGQTVSAYTVDTIGGASGRGTTVNEYRQAKGRKGMGFGGLAAWELVSP